MDVEMKNTPEDPNTVARISQQNARSFRRGTWTLAALYQGRLTREREEREAEVATTGSESLCEENEEEEDLKHPTSLQGKDLLNAFTTLCARNHKVVAAIASAQSAAFTEDTSEQRIEGHNRPDQGSKVGSNEPIEYVITRNPRFNDISSESCDSFFWVQNTGIRLVDVRKQVRNTSVGPSMSLAEHLKLILAHVDAASSAIFERKATKFKKVTSSLGIYVLRACLGKIAIRIEYHCGAAEKQQDPLRYTTEYAQYIFPEKRYPGLVTFKAIDRLAKRQREVLSRNQTNRQPFPSKLSQYALADMEVSIIQESAKALGIPFSRNYSADIYNCVASMLQVFISGCLAVEQHAAGKEAHAACFRDMLWSNTKDMDKHLYDGLKVIAKTGYSLATLAHGKTFFPQFLKDTFNDKIRESGCGKWIKLISAPFFAATVLLQRDMIERVRKAETMVLETVFKKNDQSMEPLRDFLARLNQDGSLAVDDFARLEAWLEKQRGSKYGGAIHCETSLLLLCIVAKHYPNLLPTRMLHHISKLNPRFLGISKLSCPICNEVIAVAEESLNLTIERLQSHKYYTACGLPDWLPEPLAKKLLARIEEKCRPKLVKQANRLKPRIDGRAKGSESPEPREIIHVDTIFSDCVALADADGSEDDSDENDRMDLDELMQD